MLDTNIIVGKVAVSDSISVSFHHHMQLLIRITIDDAQHKLYT